MWWATNKWGDDGDYANQRSYALLLAAGNAMQFAISDAANQLNGAFHVCNTPANSITLNAWAHVAGVYDQSTGTRRIYINGVMKAERTDAPITVLNGSAAAGLGAYLRQSTVAAAFFEGQVDEVSFYNRGLSSNKVVAIHAAGSAGKCKPPLTLAVSLTASGVLLSWPASADGYGLVSRADLAPGAWETVTNVPALNGTRKEVLLPAATPAQRFFRLSKLSPQHDRSTATFSETACNHVSQEHTMHLEKKTTAPPRARIDAAPGRCARRHHHHQHQPQPRRPALRWPAHRREQLHAHGEQRPQFRVAAAHRQRGAHAFARPGRRDEQPARSGYCRRDDD